ncbi:hypothetical protein NPIL_73081, partial [Nephila pilipes]
KFDVCGKNICCMFLSAYLKLSEIEIQAVIPPHYISKS